MRMRRERQRVATHHIQSFEGSIVADLADFGWASRTTLAS